MDYVTILKMQGFEVEVIGVEEYTSEEERFKFQIPAKFQIFLCRKKQALGVG